MKTEWRAGLIHWRHTMLNALDGLSLVFATDGSVADLSRSGSGSSTRLTKFEGRISTCSDKLRGLGPAPQPFEQSPGLRARGVQVAERGDRPGQPGRRRPAPRDRDRPDRPARQRDRPARHRADGALDRRRRARRSFRLTAPRRTTIVRAMALSPEFRAAVGQALPARRADRRAGAAPHLRVRRPHGPSRRPRPGRAGRARRPTCRRSCGSATSTTSRSSRAAREPASPAGRCPLPTASSSRSPG